MDKNKKYVAFISYTHADRAWARWLHRSIETYRVPPALRGRVTPMGILGRRIGRVFLDEAELGSSSNLTASIESALASSSSLLVVCSPQAARSPRVSEEIRYFRDVHGADRIFCLIVDGRPSARSRGLQAELECFPDPLLSGAEPLAADVRGDRPDRRGARDRLLAGLIDIGLDELRQRELARRNRRLLISSLVSGSISIAAIGLALIAISASNEANRQRAVAELEAKKSDRVLEFILNSFQSADPYETNGLEITAEQILDRALLRVDAELVEEPEIQRKMRDTMARVYHRLGEYAIAATLMRNNLDQIDDPPLSDEYFRFSGNLANTLIEVGEYDEAEQRLREQLEHYRRVPGVELTLANVANNLGRVLKDIGELEQSEELLRESIGILEATDEDPQTLMIAYNNLAIVAMQSGRKDEARGFFEKTIDLRTNAYGPEHPYVARAENNLGTLLYSLGETEEAKIYYEKALEKRRAAFGSEHAEVAESTYNVGLIHMELGNHDKALEMFHASLELDRALLSDDHPSVAYDLFGIGRAHAAAGNWTQAGAYFEQALGVAQVRLDSEHGLVVSISLLKAAYEYKIGNYSIAESMSAVVQGAYRSENRTENAVAILAGGINTLARHGQGASIEKDELKAAIEAAELAEQRVERSVLRILTEACADLGC